MRTALISMWSEWNCVVCSIFVWFALVNDKKAQQSELGCASALIFLRSTLVTLRSQSKLYGLQRWMISEPTVWTFRCAAAFEYQWPHSSLCDPLNLFWVILFKPFNMQLYTLWASILTDFYCYMLQTMVRSRRRGDAPKGRGESSRGRDRGRGKSNLPLAV